MGRVASYTLPETGQGKKEENVCSLAEPRKHRFAANREMCRMPG
jgi:hypothetical protein